MKPSGGYKGGDKASKSGKGMKSGASPPPPKNPKMTFPPKKPKR